MTPHPCSCVLVNECEKEKFFVFFFYFKKKETRNSQQQNRHKIGKTNLLYIVAKKCRSLEYIGDSILPNSYASHGFRMEKNVVKFIYETISIAGKTFHD